MKKHYIAKGIKFFIGAVAMIVLVGFVLMWLWNWLMPDLFGLREIVWIEALGLLALSKILFGGWRGKHHRGGGGRDRWRKRWDEKIESMSPEEKERWKARFEGHCHRKPRQEEEVPAGDPFTGAEPA